MRASGKQMFAAALMVLGLAPAAFGQAAPAPPPVPPQASGGADLYIIVLKNPRVGHPAVAEPDVKAFGGKQEGKWGTRRLVRLPAAAVAQLQKHGAVSYINRVYTGDPASREPVVPLLVSDDDGGAGAAAPSTWFSGEYRYDGAGNIRSIGAATDGAPTLKRQQSGQHIPVRHSRPTGGGDAEPGRGE